MPKGISEIDRIRRDAIIALSGAEYVREKLLSLSSVGPSPLSNTVYAIKCRVKSEDRLINKVLHRRKIRKKKDYKASSATDIVGFRILCIYPEDIIQAARRFIDFVDFAQSPRVGLFAKSRPNDCISEVIVFKTPTASYAYDAVRDELIHMGIEASKVDVTPATKEQPYSSIHIVCDCVSHSTSTPRIIKTEVQIRSVLEDVWAEMDHPLRYKGFNFKAGLRGMKHTQSQQRLYKSAEHNLTSLKNSFDAMAQQAEGIRGTFKALDREFSTSTGTSLPIVTKSTVLKELPQSFDNIPHSVETAINNIKNNINELMQLLIYKNNINASSTIGLCDIVLKDIRDFGSQIYKKGISEGDLEKIEYFLNLEEANIHTWRYKLGVLKGGSHEIVAETDLQIAINILLRMFHSPSLKTDALIPYRLSNAISQRNTTSEMPVKLLETALSRIDADPRMRKKSQLQLWILRQLGLARWRKCQTMREEGELVGLRTNTNELAELTAAVDYSLRAVEELERLVVDGILSDAHASAEYQKNINNEICYLWEWSVVRGQVHPTALEKRKNGELERYIEDIKVKNPEWQKDISKFDTILKGLHLVAPSIGFEDLIREFAELVGSEAGLSQGDRSALQFSLSRLEHPLNAREGVNHEVS